MKKTRLTRQLERRTKKTLFLTLIGIIIVFFVIYKLVVPFLINFSLFVDDVKNGKDQQAKEKSFIPPPLLDAQPDATNSARINVSGSGSYKDIIDLYVNDQLIDSGKVENNNSFVFKDISLKEGTNNIRAQAIRDNQKSSFSDSISVIYKSKSPSLEISSPSDGQSFSKDDKSTEVKGKTDAGNKVIINDYWAIVDDQGNFSYTLNLKDGDNLIKIVAVDDAGNKTEKELKVKYSS